MEDFRALSPEERKAWKEKATPEQLKELVKAQAAAKISEGNKQLQALKAKERQENTRKLILLGAYFKKILSDSEPGFIEQFGAYAKEESALDQETIKETEAEAARIKEKLKDKDYQTTQEEAAILKRHRLATKRLKDNEIILAEFKALKEKDQIAARTAEDS